MSAYLIVLAPAAEQDIVQALHWYRARSSLAAEGFRDEIFDLIDQLGRTPLGRPAGEDGTRKRVLKRYPYSIIYEVQGDEVTVLAIAHHRRQPNYWKIDNG